MLKFKINVKTKVRLTEIVVKKEIIKKEILEGNLSIVTIHQWL
jgi:hypothetical protein